MIRILGAPAALLLAAFGLAAPAAAQLEPGGRPRNRARRIARQFLRPEGGLK